ncbi:class I adenylate-forming enzyme family protein [Phenylobacterium immobile]|uniref:class I adenylate-forming enzyme family protein n=1 Tax=Phenylobacterium immobile TaxID=21 RepID=UPI000A6954D1|nr:class I adenylate-forming enzyme family protein [Phenylobacterium immobile]
MMTRHPNLPAAFHALWAAPERAATIALSDDDQSITYGALFETVGALAGGLKAAGVRPGDRVALALPRSVNQACAILATMVAGACPYPVETNLGAEEMARRFTMGRLTWAVIDGAAADATVPDQAVTLQFADLAGGTPYWALDLGEEAPGLLLFTSGSSGRPKGVLESHRGLMVNAAGVVERTGLTPADLLLHVMPLHHTNGVNNQIFAPLLAGASVHIAPRFLAQDMPDLMARVRPTILTGVPTMYARMLPLDFAPEALAAVRMMRCGSAPITEDLHQRIEAKFDRPLVVSYGLSEATCTSTMNPPEARRIGSVGTVMPGQTVTIHGADDALIAAPDVDGEIRISGPSLMLGYLTEESHGEPVPPGPVIRTGDLGRFDAEGYLSITGRIKDVIIRGGENLSPQLIEETLIKVPGVAAVCIIGAPDADLGETPWAFVVRDASNAGAGLSAETLATAAQDKFGRSHQPSKVVFLDVLPENSVGKVDRQTLREIARRTA